MGVPAHSTMRMVRALASSDFLRAVRVTLGLSTEAKECSAGRVPVWAKDLASGEGVVELVGAVDGESLLPGAGVGVEGVGEVLGTAVGVGVGPGGGAEEGKAEGVAEGVVGVLGVVEDGEALLWRRRGRPSGGRGLRTWAFSQELVRRVVRSMEP